MSRIGKKPIPVPSKAKVTITNGVVSVEAGGKKLDLTVRPEVNVTWDESEKNLVVSIKEGLEEDRFARAMWGTTRSLLQNMIDGVVKGFEKKLEVVGVGWSATVAGPNLELKVGFANPVVVPIPQGVDVKVEKSVITINGVDKQSVGEFAATVRSKRKPEPYNGKGVKYVNEVIRRKSGKAFGS